MQEIEIWKPVINYSQYQISNWGNVKITANQFTRKERFLKPLITKRGYYRVALYLNNKSAFYYIHRLVAIHFIPNSENKETVNHIDGNKLNNHFSNLEWNTLKENMAHSIINKISACGERNGRSKLTQNQVEEIKNNSILNQYELALKYNVSQSTINRIKTNKGWKL